MKIVVKLLAIPPAQFPPGITQPVTAMEVATGTHVAEVLSQLQFAPEKLAEKVLLVNGRDAEFEQELHDGDEIALFSRVAGG